MPEQSNAIVASLSEQILRYLDDHPSAADSREGISRWWLGHSASGVTPEAVQGALDDLVRQGLVQCRQVAGNEAVYSRAAGTDDRDRS